MASIHVMISGVRGSCIGPRWLAADARSRRDVSRQPVQMNIERRRDHLTRAAFHFAGEGRGSPWRVRTVGGSDTTKVVLIGCGSEKRRNSQPLRARPERNFKGACGSKKRLISMTARYDMESNRQAGGVKPNGHRESAKIEEVGERHVANGKPVDFFVGLRLGKLLEARRANRGTRAHDDIEVGEPCVRGCSKTTKEAQATQVLGGGQILLRLELAPRSRVERLDPARQLGLEEFEQLDCRNAPVPIG